MKHTKYFLLIVLLFVTAVKAQSTVTISSSSIDQAAANTIQGHLNSGNSVIVTSASAITMENGVTILKSAGTDATLTFKANFRVTMNVNTSIKSTAGKLNLIFWSNATNDAGTKGMIRFGDHTQPVANVIIESNGGHLWMGGGNTNTSWNGLTVGNGYAWGSASPGNNGWYGIELYGDCRFFTSGGNVSLNGRSTDQTSGQGYTYAIFLIRSIINAGAGNIDINTLTDGSSPAAGETTGIAINGDGGFTTTTGNITINNTIAVQGNTSGSATGIYLERSDSGNPVITSNQGNVSIVTSFSGAAAPTKYYIDINEININREKSVAGASFTELVPSILSGGSSTFTSSSTAVATVTNSGLVSPAGTGVTNITGVFARSDWSPVNSRWRYKLEIRSEADPILSFSQAEVYKNVSDASYTLTATQLNQSGIVGAITYTSSNRSVATVDSSTGAVTIVGEGSTVINATSARTVTYVKEGNASYTLYVVNGLVVFTSSVNSSSAGVTAYGNAVSDGGTAITERGFVYSLTSNPTTSNTKVISGSGTGLFSQSISGLSTSTTYYLSAYATNSLGTTSYGSDLSFTTASAFVLSVLNKNGGLTSDPLQAVNKYGAKGSGKGLSQFGGITHAPIPLVVGSSYGGGKVFYLFVSGNPGYVAGETHGLIAAVNLVDTYISTTGDKWSNANVVTGATANTIGSGAGNTDLILQNDASAIAAKRSSDFSITIDGVTYDDWYLPSKIELQKLYIVWTQILSTTLNHPYWSSTEESSTNAATIRFSDGAYFTGYKTSTKAHVTAIRKF